MLAAVDPIELVSPRPSLLTSARDRTNDGFGAVAGATLELLDFLDDEEERALVRRQLTAWRTGIAWTPMSCHPSSVWPRCPEPGREKQPADGLTSPTGTDVFAVYTPLNCEWVTDSSRLDQAVQDLVEVHSAFAAARALWFGEGLPDEVNVNGVATPVPTLRDTADDVSINGAAAPIEDVFAILLALHEDCTGGNGGATLHVPTVAIPSVLGASDGGVLARREGDTYRGPGSSVVSPGPGYPHGASTTGPGGNGPATGNPDEYQGNPADEVWVYVTGPVEYALGPIEVLPPEDAERRGFYRTNRYDVWGERLAIVRFDPCCVFAALAVDPTGAAS